MMSMEKLPFTSVGVDSLFTGRRFHSVKVRRADVPVSCSVVPSGNRSMKHRSSDRRRRAAKFTRFSLCADSWSGSVLAENK